MTDFIKGKITNNKQADDLFDREHKIYSNEPREFSDEAIAVFNAGRELWKYFHQQKDINVNASLYEIREYFQGRNDKGIMKSRSTDEQYTKLISDLREKMKVLADKISTKVHEYEFLKG